MCSYHIFSYHVVTYTILSILCAVCALIVFILTRWSRTRSCQSCALCVLLSYLFLPGGHVHGPVNPVRSMCSYRIYSYQVVTYTVLSILCAVCALIVLIIGGLSLEGNRVMYSNDYWSKYNGMQLHHGQFHSKYSHYPITRP